MIRFISLFLLTIFSLEAKGLALIVANDEVFNTDEQLSAGFEIRYCHNPYWAFHTGLDVYTPKNKTTKEPLPGERPYNSWMYFGGSYQNELKSLPLLFTLNLDLGVRGPKAKGEELQNGAHKFFDANKVNGWDSETEHEYGALSSAIFEFGLLTSLDTSIQKHMQLSLIAEANVGTIVESYSSGINMLIGIHTPKYYTSRVTPRKSALYLLAKIQTIHVNKNNFLDGNSGYNVKKTDHIKRYDIGINVDIDFYRIRLMATTMSREFTTQYKEHRYATLELGFTF